MFEPNSPPFDGYTTTDVTSNTKETFFKEMNIASSRGKFISNSTLSYKDVY